MFYLIVILVGSLSGLIPLIPVMAGWQGWLIRDDRQSRLEREQKQPTEQSRKQMTGHDQGQVPDLVATSGISKLHLIGGYVFGWCLTAILSVTGIPDAYNWTVDPNINLVPLRDIMFNFPQYGLNILLFVPVGLLLPLLWQKFSSWRLTLLSGFLFSLAIELAQIFSDRITDLDDLLMNTLGTAGGYLLWLGWKKLWPQPVAAAATGSSTGHWRGEPYFYWVTAGLVMFFIQPLLQPLIAAWLWGGQIRIK